MDSENKKIGEWEKITHVGAAKISGKKVMVLGNKMMNVRKNS